MPIPALNRASRRGRHRSTTSRRRATLAGAAAGALALVASSVAAPSLVTGAASASPPIQFGASGDVDQLSRSIGAPLARHVYGQLDGPVKQGDMINLAPNVDWKVIATARPGSAPHNNLVRWANGLKNRSGRILLAFSHEPEGKTSDGYGTSAEFIAAWRKVHDVFQAQGVRNVDYTWTMTSNAFRVPSGDNRYAPKWYPGDAYVDYVGSAAYNYYDCGEGRGQWLSLADRAAAPLAWAKRQGKDYVLAEWASQSGSRRADWLRDANAFFLKNQESIRGTFYFQSPRTRPGCNFKLTQSEELRVFGSMAKDSANFDN